MSISLNLPTERSAVAKGRIVQLDGLRAIAILLVILNHGLRVPIAWVGVDIFFVLSGFLITGILLARKQAGEGYFGYFYRRRVFRILPSYYLSLLIFMLLFGWWSFHPWPLLVFPGMNVQALFYRTSNPLPLWSLAVEEQFYLVWPLVIFFVSEKVLLRLAVAAVLITPLLRVLVTPHFYFNQLFIYMLTPFRADLLCAGAILALLWKKRSPDFETRCRSHAWVGVVMGFGSLLLLQHWKMFRIASNTRWSNGLDYSLSLIGAISLLAWALADRGWLRRFLSSRPMRYIGEISYTMYLVHMIVFFILYQKLHVASAPLRFTVMLFGSIAWASVSWFLMERPLIRFAARTGHHKTFVLPD